MAILETLRFRLTRWTTERDQFTRVQMDDTHTNIEAEVGKFTSGSAAPSLPDSSYEQSFFYNTSSSELKFSAAGTSWDPMVVDIDPVTLTSAQTLTNKTLTSPVISQIRKGSSTLTLPSSATTLIGKNTTDTLENKTFDKCTFNNPKLLTVREKWNIVGSAPAGTQNINIVDASSWYFTSNATTNISLNLRGSLTVPLSTLVKEGRTISVAVAVKNGSTPRYITSVLVDGASQSVKWATGSAPTAGNANSVDIYLITVHRKSGSTPAYSVFAQQTQFA